MNWLPPFDWYAVIVQPWTTDFSITLDLVAMGFFVTAACGLVGNYLLLRRMALLGDAISHSILPGLILAFMLFRETSLWVSTVGALSAGFLTIILIGWIHQYSRIKSDAAICIVFTTFFAIGVILMSFLESKGSFHIDADCVLYGQIALIPLEPSVVWMGIPMLNASILRMAGAFVAVAVAIFIFYKELLVTSFDSGLAKSLGIQPGFWHFALMGALSFVVVFAFEAVGAILAVAMLIVPPMFAAQLSHRLPIRFLLTIVHAALSAVIGVHLSTWLGCSPAGAMVLAGSFVFAVAWAGTGISKLRLKSLQVENVITPVRRSFQKDGESILP